MTTAATELGQARWDCAPRRGALPAPLRQRLAIGDDTDDCKLRRHCQSGICDDDDVNAELVDWTALHRVVATASAVPSAAEPVVENPLKSVAQRLIETLGGETKASRVVVDECAAHAKASPALYATHVLVPLVVAGGAARCELVQLVAKDCLPKLVLADFASTLLRRDDVPWTDDRIALWQKGLLPGFDSISAALLAQLLASLELADKSPRLAGLLFLVCKMAGAPALRQHASTCTRLLAEKCTGGPLVAQTMKLLT